MTSAPPNALTMTSAHTETSAHSEDLSYQSTLLHMRVVGEC